MKTHVLQVAALLLLLNSLSTHARVQEVESTQMGVRPFYLVDELPWGELKRELRACAEKKGKYRPSDFSIGHRGAALQFPEHTKESYLAAARQGAGILECDVTFTSDAELVCRHAQCDLHTTTNIVATPLAEKCTVPPEFDLDGNLVNASDIKCCASDLTLAEFKTLEGKMDAADTTATTVADYLGGTPTFRTDLYATGATLLTHAESIRLIRSLGRKFTPELKGADSGEVPPKNTLEDVFGPLAMPEQTAQQAYAAKMIREYLNAGVRAKDVWAQSFNYEDVLYWISEFPRFGRQAVFLDSRYSTDVNDPAAVAALDPSMQQLVADGVEILAPPMFMMLATDEAGNIVPSAYAEAAKMAGLDMIGWTTERSGRSERGGGGFYYSTVSDAITGDGTILEVIDVLAQDVGIIGLFSDWPATTTFYANCKSIPNLEGSVGRGGRWKRGYGYY